MEYSMLIEGEENLLCINLRQQRKGVLLKKPIKLALSSSISLCLRTMECVWALLME